MVSGFLVAVDLVTAYMLPAVAVAVIVCLAAMGYQVHLFVGLAAIVGLATVSLMLIVCSDWLLVVVGLAEFVG